MEVGGGGGEAIRKGRELVLWQNITVRNNFLYNHGYFYCNLIVNNVSSSTSEIAC